VIVLAALALPAVAQPPEPEFWEMVGVGGVLRSVPLDGGSVVDRPEAGTVVRGLGCQQSRGRRWCEVERVDKPGVTGWIGNNNLRAAAAADAPPPEAGSGSPPPD